MLADPHPSSFSVATCPVLKLLLEIAGLDHEWSLEQYGVLLEIGGGKERMDHYFSSCADREPWAGVTGGRGWLIGSCYFTIWEWVLQGAHGGLFLVLR